MIIYKGIHKKDHLFFLSFENDQKKTVNIPIDKHYASLIETRLRKISVAETPLIEPQNEEPSE